MDNNLDNNQGGRRPDKGDPRRNQDPNRNKKNHQSILAFLICLLVTLVCFSLFTNMLQDNSSEITYDKFIDMVNNDEVKSVTLQSDTLTIVPKKQVSPYQEISYYTNLTEDETALTKRLEGTGIIFKSEPPDAFGEFMAMMLSVLLPSVLLFVLLMFFMRRMNKGGGGVMGVGKSRAKAYVQKETGITFKDVAGQDEAKESLEATIFMVTHDSFAASFCDRVVILRDGVVWRTLEKGATDRTAFQDQLLDAIRDMGKE